MIETKLESKKEEFKLPDEVTKVEKDAPARDLVVISQPKMGKGSIFGDFTKKYNALVFDLEKGGYEYIDARKVSTYTSQETSRWESYQNYIKYRKVLLESKGKYKYLLIDGLSDLDDLSEIGATLGYMNSVIGSSFNRELGADGKPIKNGPKLEMGDPNWKSVLTLPDGAGYQHTR